MKIPTIEEAFKFLGESKHGPTVVVCAIALFKGIFRPIFTLKDKKSDPQTKKYAAIREGLTELVALPIYAITPTLVEKGIINKIYKNKEAGVKGIIQKNAGFLTLCAATLLIPAVCNIIQPPIMNAYKKKQEAKKAKNGLDVSVGDAVTNPVQIPSAPINPPAQTNNKPYTTTALATNKAYAGMKVGG